MFDFPIFCINLKSRADRKEKMIERFKQAQLTQHITFIQAIDGQLLDKPTHWNGYEQSMLGAVGCLMSHREVMKLIVTQGFKQALILEDDVILCDDFLNRLSCFVKQLPEIWHIAYLGGNHQGNIFPENINVVRVTNTLTTSSYLITHQACCRLLDEIPCVSRNCTQPIDIYYAKYQSNNPCFCARPHLAWQESGFSNIEQKYVEMPYLNPTLPKASLIISSCNQAQRLYYSVESATKQKYFNYEVIVADDSSTDETNEVLKQFPGVIVSRHTKDLNDSYTLAENWNKAVEISTGDRLIFTNGDCVFPPTYIDAHMLPTFRGKVCFAPNERTTELIEECFSVSKTTKELIKNYKQKGGQIQRDLRHDDSAYTFNVKYPYFYVWGNNFSVDKRDFLRVGGFCPLKTYGGEDILLAKRLFLKANCEVVSNCEAANLHLWHPVKHSMQAPFEEEKWDLYVYGPLCDN